MRPYLFGGGIGLAIAVVGAALGQVPIVVLGVVLGLLIVGIVSMRVTQSLHVEEIGSDLSPDSRILLKPLRASYLELEAASQGKVQTLSPYLASEAMQEARQLLEKSASALALRDRFIKQSRGSYEAQKSTEDLQARLATAMSDEERASLKTAIDARQNELGHYQSLKDAAAKIETSVRQSTAIMAELRANMFSSASTALAQDQADPLRESLGRMQSLTKSLTEAEGLLQNEN